MRESVLSEGMSVTVCMHSKYPLNSMKIKLQNNVSQFPKLNGNFRETKPLSKVFNSGLSSWRPLKSEQVSTLSEIPHFPGWVLVYSAPANWTPGEESAASQEVPCLIINLYHTVSSLYANSLTASLWLIKYNFSKHIFWPSVFVPSKNQWLLSPLHTSDAYFTAEDWVLL